MKQFEGVVCVCQIGGIAAVVSVHALHCATAQLLLITSVFACSCFEICTSFILLCVISLICGVVVEASRLRLGLLHLRVA